MARTSSVALCLLFVVGNAWASRHLLQSSCLNKASTAVSGPCQDFIGLQSSLPPGNATDAQLQAVLNKSTPPSQSCCAEAGDLVTHACQCNPTVQQFAGIYDLTPTNLITFARMAKLSCGQTYIASSVNPFCNSTAPSAGR